MSDAVEPAVAAPPVAAAAPTSGGGRRIRVLLLPARLPALIAEFAELLPWQRHRRCERGDRPCYECSANTRYFTTVRGGATREEWRAARAASQEHADTITPLVPAPLRPRQP